MTKEELEEILRVIEREIESGPGVTVGVNLLQSSVYAKRGENGEMILVKGEAVPMVSYFGRRPLSWDDSSSGEVEADFDVGETVLRQRDSPSISGMREGGGSGCSIRRQ